MTQTWVTTDGEHIVINTPDWTQKTKNVARDARIAVNVVDPDETRRYFAVRGRVIYDDRGRSREHRRDLPEVPGYPLPELLRASGNPDIAHHRSRLGDPARRMMVTGHGRHTWPTCAPTVRCPSAVSVDSEGRLRA